MKKHSKNLISSIALLTVLCIGYPTLSFGDPPAHGIKYTKHNMSTTRVTPGNWMAIAGSGGGAETEVCIFCHTPHNAAAGKKFLWNRIDSTATFLLYTASSTLNFAKTPGATISSMSKLCMSCHDGGTALNAMANPRGIQMATNADQLGDWWDPADPGSGLDPGQYGPNIGEGVDPLLLYDPTPGGNLVNDHPISFIYTESEADPTINTSGGGGYIGGLPLWYENGGYRVECMTCHDPHINYGEVPNTGGNIAYKPFLRKTMNSSSLCFTCHNK